MAQHGTDGPYDITRILAQVPNAMNEPRTRCGAADALPSLGEPLYGYYRSDDAWVIAHHAQMLSDAAST